MHPTSPTSPSPWRRRLILLALAFVLRVSYLIWVQGNPFFNSPVVDAQTYDEQAQQILKGIWSDGDAFWQPPLYPYFLAGLYALVGRNFLWVKLIQALLGSLTCVLASELAARHCSRQDCPRQDRGARVGWLTGLLLAFYGPLWFYDGELLVPVLSLFLDTAALWLLVSAGFLVPSASEKGENETPGRGSSLLAGLLLGLSAIARPTVLLFVGGLVGYQLWRLRPRGPARGRSSLIPLILLLVGVSLPILPVTLHNRLIAHEPVLISSNGGINFYLGNHPDYDKTVGIRPGIAWKALMQEPIDAGIQGDANTSRYWMQRGLDALSASPLDALKLYARKTWLLVQADELYRNLDYRFFAQQYAPFLLYLPAFGMLLPLALLGLWRSRPSATSSQSSNQAILWIFLGAQAVGIVLFFVVARYRLSLVPVLAIYAGVGIDTLIQAAKGARAQPLPFLKPAAATLLLALLFQWDPYQAGGIDVSEGYNLTGQALSNAGRSTDALAAFVKAQELNPQNIDAVFNRARELHILKRCPEALPLYEQALKHYPKDRDSLNNRAICLLTVGQRSAGIDGLKQVVALYPHSPDVYYNLAQALEQDGQLEAAIEALEKAAAQAPETPMVQELLAEWRARQAPISRLAAALEGLLTRAIQAKNAGSKKSNDNESLEEKRSTDPSEASLLQLNNAGHRALRAGNASEAIALFHQALETQPGYAVAWSNLGQALYLEKRWTLAERAFRMALELRPEFDTARMGWGMTLMELPGQENTARLELERLLTTLPPEQAGLRARAEALLKSLDQKVLGNNR